MTDATAAPDEEAVEEATAALANLDAEFGRTTDPVRMYMREMGTVELLTREGEIRIAKRIEEGLEAVKIALGSYPGTYDLLLRHYETVKAGQMRLVDVIVGFVDPNAPDEIAQPQNPKMMALEREEAANDEDEADGDEDEEVIDTGPDPEEAAKRFSSIAKLHHQFLSSLDKLGSKDPPAPTLLILVPPRAPPAPLPPPIAMTLTSPAVGGVLSSGKETVTVISLSRSRTEEPRRSYISGRWDGRFHVSR